MSSPKRNSTKRKNSSSGCKEQKDDPKTDRLFCGFVSADVDPNLPCQREVDFGIARCQKTEGFRLQGCHEFVGAERINPFPTSCQGEVFHAPLYRGTMWESSPTRLPLVSVGRCLGAAAFCIKTPSVKTCGFATSLNEGGKVAAPYFRRATPVKSHHGTALEAVPYAILTYHNKKRGAFCASFFPFRRATRGSFTSSAGRYIIHASA